MDFTIETRACNLRLVDVVISALEEAIGNGSTYGGYPWVSETFAFSSATRLRPEDLAKLTGGGESCRDVAVRHRNMTVNKRCITVCMFVWFALHKLPTIDCGNRR